MKRLEPERPLETTWEDWVLGGGVRAAFDDPTLPLHVEIGPGDDDFLLECAVDDPSRNWLGIEYSRKRVRRYARKVRERAGELPNLRLIWRPAADVVGPFLTPERVETYHVYFPDPWPKAHHARYRMMDEAMIVSLRESLVHGGSIRVATDSAKYARQMLETLEAVDGLSNALPPPGFRVLESGDRMTVFEERWRAEGREILSLHFQRD